MRATTRQENFPMEWLKYYEGKRGLAYLSIIVSSIAPSYCAMFILDGGRPPSSELTSNVFACASLGATIGTLLSIISAFSLAKRKKTLNDKNTSVSMAVGFSYGLIIQAVVLSYTMWRGGNFDKYYANCFVFTIFYLLLQIPIGIASQTLKNLMPDSNQG